MGDLGSVDTVVHEQEVNVLGVVDEESLVAGGHHVASLLVRAETDLSFVSNPTSKSLRYISFASVCRHGHPIFANVRRVPS